MPEDIFNIGDVVALISHPYHFQLTNIKVSGEPLLLSPLMVVIEVFLGKSTSHASLPVIRYKCLWFSSKLQSFEHAWIKKNDLKLISSKRINFVPSLLQHKELLSLGSMDFELSKLKSSLSFSDGNSSLPKGDTTMNALLSFLCPSLQVISAKPHISKLQLHDKATGEIIRYVPTWDIKCFWYNHLKETLSEVVLPIEALKLIDEVSFETLQQIDTEIEFNNVLVFESEQKLNLIKPKHVAFRSGYYFLRAFDYLRNENIEINLKDFFSFSSYPQYYTTRAPIFDAKSSLKMGPKTVKKEILRCIKIALRSGHYIRIKYKNRNEELSIRTLRDFELVPPKGGPKTVKYLIGYCGLRQEERTFKITRIQSIEELIIKF